MRQVIDRNQSGTQVNKGHNKQILPEEIDLLGDRSYLEFAVSLLLGDRSCLESAVSPLLGDRSYLEFAVSPLLGDRSCLESAVSPLLGFSARLTGASVASLEAFGSVAKIPLRAIRSVPAGQGGSWSELNRCI